jgi:putative tryptophan/tyrosine transport system substrate-binding protein
MAAPTILMLVFAAAGGIASTAPAAGHGPVAVVSVPGVEAFSRTVEGIRERIPGVQVLDAGDEARLRENLDRLRPALAIAVGAAAAAALGRTAPAGLPLMGTLLLESEAALIGRLARPRAIVTVDLSPAVLFQELKRSFPGKTRIGVVCGPMQAEGFVRAVEEAARQAGLTAILRTCREARSLVDVFLSLKEKADLVWCPPNQQLYTTATLKPLIVASITNHLPIVGFSEQFVRAGALFGGAPDFRLVGEQTAALALRILRNETVPARQEASRFRFAYNQRVARLIGLKADGAEHADFDIVR